MVQLSLGSLDLTNAVWSSSDESVAVVDQEGTVTAVGSGSCKIIALIDEVKYITYIISTYDPSLVQTDTVVLGEMTLTNENYSSAITLSGVPDGTTVQWSSSDESVAVVDQEGVVTAVGSGSCQIIALINGVNYVMNVTSEYAPVAAIEIYAESTEISGIGNTLALTVLNTDETPEWISTDINVATVDENGVVTAVGEGTVLIIAKINNVPYTITITVKSDVLYGDANLSGDVNISDAVAILSYVSNSDKYALSEQQIDAADVYMRGDGLNNMDALSVQKFISNNLSALPESYT
ncbi:MAG: dockerin type I repeat-containing protein [Ruminococcus sp.]|nr:dockerin type I repeat-containing protein [Ruminococcus sp.]